MNVRIVVADERQANFFDVAKPSGPLVHCESVENAKAGLKDRDLETDRAGRGHSATSGVTYGGGAVQGHRNGVDGERSAEQHELTVFAKDVAQHIDTGRLQNEFDKLVIMAPPKMLGLLRKSLSPKMQALLAGEVSKDLVQHDSKDILKAIPRETFFK